MQLQNMVCRGRGGIAIGGPLHGPGARIAQRVLLEPTAARMHGMHVVHSCGCARGARGACVYNNTNITSSTI